MARVPLTGARGQARPRRQIVALGGGGFTEDPDGRALDDYVLAASGRARPRVCFLPTAGGDASGYVVRFYAAFAGGGCEPSHLALFNRTVDDLRGFLLAQDVIYVGGGNTVNLLAVWRAQGVDAILREAWRRGVVLAGLCAGAMCWFEGGVTASFGRRLTPLHDGLGLLPGTACPHYRARRDAYLAAVGRGLPPGIGIEDGVALHYVGRRLAAVVSARPGARAHRVTAREGVAQESPLAARPLAVAAGEELAAVR